MGQEDINLEIRKRRFRWLGHTLRKEDGDRWRVLVNAVMDLWVP
jgi:hypothetical protein